jgi:hypothetical protein
MTNTDTDNAVNEASIAAFLAAAHARLGFDNRTYLGVTHGESGARWNVYGHFTPPIGFCNESAKTLEESAQKFTGPQRTRKASPPSSALRLTDLSPTP